MKSTAVTEDDLQDALTEQIRAHYAAAQAKERQPGEFSVQDYIKANRIPQARRRAIARALDEDVEMGAATKRDGCVQNGKPCVFYKFKGN